jgi:hypothetical protein
MHGTILNRELPPLYLCENYQNMGKTHTHTHTHTHARTRTRTYLHSDRLFLVVCKDDIFQNCKIVRHKTLK